MPTRMVLLVTADTVFAAQVTDVLTRAQCAVLIARDTHDALEAVQRLRPDVLLLDDRSGVKQASGTGVPELARRARRLGTHGFIIRARHGALIDTPPLADGHGWPVLSHDVIGADVALALDRVLARPVVADADRIGLR